ncbi:MAG: hypothetical protein Q9202_003786 [Teloschistes flavicans]
MSDTISSSLSNIVKSLQLSDNDSATPQISLSHTNEEAAYLQYGSLTSLYDSIPACVATSIERASILCRVRAFPECHSVFDSIEVKFRRHPIVAYEEFLAYWAQWRLSKSAEILETALTLADKSGNNVKAPRLYTLLRIALAKAKVFTKGDFTKARQSMMEVKSWLQDVTVTQYTDLQVACLAHYYFLILAIPQFTGDFDSQSFRQIPLAIREVDTLNLTQLRQAIQAQGRIRDARLILSFEIGFLPNELAKQAACRSLIEACASALQQEPAWSVESAARSMLAQSLRRAGNVVEANGETHIALDLLKQAPFTGERNNAHAMVELDQMKATTFANSKESFTAWTDFSEEDLVKEDSSILLWSLEKIADAALEILQANPSLENKAVFWQCQRRYESLLQELGDVYFLYMSKLFTGQTALSLFDELGASIKMHEEFHAQYPKFALWTLMIAGKRTVALLHVRIGQQDEVIKIFSEISDLIRQQEAFWTENSSDIEDADVQDLRGHGANEKDTSLFAGIMRTEWFAEWVDTSYVGLGRDVRDFPVALGPELRRGVDPFMSTLLGWLRRGVIDTELTAAEQRCILDVAEDDESMHKADMVATLQKLDPTTLKLRLYGPSDSPTASTRWEALFEIFEDWLLHRVDDIETKRHVLLGALQAEMLDSLVSTTRQLDILQSAKKMLDLIPRFNEEAQRHFEGRTVNWRNVACLAQKNLLAQQDEESSWNEQSPGFREILDMYKISLKESRNRGHLMNEAATLFFMAQHYHHGAMLLRPAAYAAFLEYLDAANTVFDKSRESWKVLKGWAKVEKLLSAVQEQLRLTIAPLLTSVICQLRDEELRAQALWGTIQIAKSSGLGWLMQTNDAAESKQAEDTSRFDVDFEELPTLTREDLLAISNDAGGNVCYVDWYVSITSSGTTRAEDVHMTWNEIDEIIEKFSFDESDLRDKDALKLLQRLNPLVEPLAKVTEAGQVMVFSSIGSLHRLPLHALAINGELLIKRNPIVYCSSFTVLHSVFKKRKAVEQMQASAPKDPSSSRAFVLGDPPSQAGTKALRKVAQKFSTWVRNRDYSTSSNLTEALLDPSLNLLHYHGHAIFQEGNPKDHGLELGDRHFTLRDIFDLELDPRPHSQGHHVTLLGCGTGMSKTSLSNDVLGLVPAFLYSGASSTVSTLWPFDDKDAATYTRVFYKDFEKGGVVDLAKANQRAVLAIMEKTPALYHWGSFVVNGYWML